MLSMTEVDYKMARKCGIRFNKRNIPENNYGCHWPMTPPNLFEELKLIAEILPKLKRKDGH